MSRICNLCGRTDKRAAKRSHSKIKTLRKQKINLQTRKIKGNRIKICTRCIKSLLKQE